MTKTISLLLIAIAVSGLIGPTNFDIVQAESSTPKPSVPEFTLKFVDNSYDVPPAYGIDPYTGKNVITMKGYHVQNKTIVLTVENQPHVINDNVLYYNVRWKGHFSNSWIYYPREYLLSSISDYTIMVFGFFGNNDTKGYYTMANLDIPSGGQVDFQVQAFRGYSTTIEGTPGPLSNRPTYQTTYTGVTSGWSNTQTIIVGESGSTEPPNASPSQNPTAPLNQSNTQSGLGWVEVGLFAVAGIIIALLIVNIVYMKRRRMASRLTQP